MEEYINDIWKNINCEACWQEDISTCKNCEWKCIQFKALENILNELDRLQKENEELKKRQIYLVNERRELEKIAFESNENYIPKQVIRDKIEELEEELKEYDLKEYCLYEDTIQERIKIYKELLGE